MSRFWMIRAGRGSKYATEFEKAGSVGIGWTRAGDFSSLDSLEAVRARIESVYADDPPGRRNASIAQMNKFRNTMLPGDRVVTYDGSTREFILGTLQGDYEYRPNGLREFNHLRAVKWQGRIPKDALRRSSLNTLGALLTVFEPGDGVLADLEDALVTGRRSVARAEDTIPDGREDLDRLFDEFESSYLNTEAGAKHAVGYIRQGEEGRRNYADILRRRSESEDVTDLILERLLPHTDSEFHRHGGHWIHIAPAINKDIRSWYEGAGWTAPEEWPSKALFILDFVQRVVEHPDQLDAACSEFSASPLAKGLQCGMITPILNALDPERFAVINRKIVGTLPAVSGQDISSGLADYPDSNTAVLEFVEANENLFERGTARGILPVHTFDMFSHWYVAVRDPEGTESGADSPVPTQRHGRASIDRETARGAGVIIERMSEDEAPRAAALSYLAASIRLAHSLAPGGWSVTLKERLVRLNVGSIFAMDLEANGVAVVLDSRSLDAVTRRDAADYALESNFRWLSDAAVYFVPFDELDPTLAQLRPAHEVFLRQATAKSDKAPWKSSHSPGVLKYLRSVGQDVPDPSHSGSSRPSAARVSEGTPTAASTNPLYTIEAAAAETLIQPATLERWIRTVNRKGQAIFYGPPGTGKTFIADHLARVLTSGGDGIVELVQFHPAYTYEDFMQGIRPHSGTSGALRYEMAAGRFVDFCRRSEGRRGASVLIIDEINRANLASVFGELMYLLEYRNREVPLAGGGAFRIPPNVRIIGTMNTADRSVALVDHALRRRFGFIRLDPDYDVLTRFHQRYSREAGGLVEVLTKLNTAIRDVNYSVGISFFMREKLAENLEAIWTEEIEPYIEELFFDNRAEYERFRWSEIAKQVAM